MLILYVLSEYPDVSIYWRILMTVATGFAVCGCARKVDHAEGSSPKATGLVRVAAAADLKFAFEEITARFNQESNDVRIETTFGSSGNFYAQLARRAPYDMFLSADVEYPRKLIADGMASKDSEFHYAIGRIVLWVRGESPIDVESLGIQALLAPGVHKVAIANPRHAPYGRAAEAAMKNLNVYDAVESKLVLGENVAQVAQFVESGSADVGILALSLAVAPTRKANGRYWRIPQEAYPKIDQGGVIFSWAQDPGAAEQLKAFLLGEHGRAILARYGFDFPGD